MNAKVGILLFVPLLTVGLVSFVIVRNQQGEGGSLVANQQHAEGLTPAKVAEVVRAAPESAHGPSGRSATCVARGSGELHNPWHCTIEYPRGKMIEYRVILSADGAYTGDQQIVDNRGRIAPSNGRISGCCVAVP